MMVLLAKHQVRAAPMRVRNPRAQSLHARIFGYASFWQLPTSPASWCFDPNNKQILLATLHSLLQLQVQMRRSTRHACCCCTALWMTSCSPPSGAKNFAAAALCPRLKRWDVMLPLVIGLASYRTKLVENCDAAAQMAHPSPHLPWRFSGRS